MDGVEGNLCIVHSQRSEQSQLSDNMPSLFIFQSILFQDEWVLNVKVIVMADCILPYLAVLEYATWQW